MNKIVNRGFTLIEVLIVLVIIGIIAAFAYPSYVESVNKAKRSEAKAALASTAQAFERCFTRNNSYTGANCPSTSFETESNNYTVTMNSAATAYTVTATPLFNDERCGIFTVNHQGLKTSSNNNYCW